MTKVGQVKQEIKVIPQSNEGTQVQDSNADAKLREAFGSNQVEEYKLPKSLKVHDLNYEGFPKAYRLDASEFAGRSLNEVKDAVREFNSDFPESPYVVDYTEFPRPEHFDKKNYGGKDKAYNAWKDAVTEWVEDCKQDMVARKSNHIGSMTEKFERAMNNGFFNIYLEMGMTRDFIQATYEALQGNINDVKAFLDAKVEEIKIHTSRVGNSVTNRVNANTNNRAEEIEAQLTFESDEIQKQNEGSRRIGALSDAISAALQGSQNTIRTDETLNRVEKLKLDIIKSNKIGDSEKVNLLNKLLKLINTDDWIDKDDLNKIITENVRII